MSKVFPDNSVVTIVIKRNMTYFAKEKVRDSENSFFFRDSSLINGTYRIRASSAAKPK